MTASSVTATVNEGSLCDRSLFAKGDVMFINVSCDYDVLVLLFGRVWDDDYLQLIQKLMPVSCEEK